MLLGLPIWHTSQFPTSTFFPKSEGVGLALYKLHGELEPCYPEHRHPLGVSKLAAGCLVQQLAAFTILTPQPSHLPSTPCCSHPQARGTIGYLPKHQALLASSSCPWAPSH